MKTISFKNLMTHLNFKHALILSLAFHMVILAFIPSFAFNREARLKEKSHNKVRITMLKKTEKVVSPEIKTASYKPKSIRKPRRIQKISKARPMMARLSNPVVNQQTSIVSATHKTIKTKAMMKVPKRVSLVNSSNRARIQKNNVNIASAVHKKTKIKAIQRVPDKLLVRTASNRASFRNSTPAIKLAQLTPKVKSSSYKKQSLASLSTHKRVGPRSVNNLRLSSSASIMPIARAGTKVKNSGIQTPAMLISTSKDEFRRPDIKVKSKFSSIAQESTNRPQVKAMQVSQQISNMVKVASLQPKSMIPVNRNHSPKENEIATEVIEQIMNDFYSKVGRQIALAKIYPGFAKKMGYQGKILVAFRINRDGEISSLSVSKSSGYKILDEAALETVKEAGPYPAIPNELNKKFLKLKIPISYALR